jgi:hypothetical protein
VILTEDVQYSTAVLADILGNASKHIPILLQAWAYILSARWAKILPSARLVHQDKPLSTKNLDRSSAAQDDRHTVIINVGQVTEDAARWWKAILSVEQGWDAIILNKKGEPLHSPWHTTLSSECPLLVTYKTKAELCEPSYTTSSLESACTYLTDYCAFHCIDDEVVLAALAAVLLILATKYDDRPIVLPCQGISSDQHEHQAEHQKALQFTIPDQAQLDKLLTLSCRTRGMKALLTSGFFEPDVDSNTCGM